MSRKKGNNYEKIWIQTINSGSFWHDKGDVKTDEDLVEIKGTEKKSYRLTTDLLKKIWDEAFDSNKIPMFGVVIDRPKERFILKIDIVKEMK